MRGGDGKRVTAAELSPAANGRGSPRRTYSVSDALLHSPRSTAWFSTIVRARQLDCLLIQCSTPWQYELQYKGVAQILRQRRSVTGQHPSFSG